MEKNNIPEGFTLSMALMDALPVIFFGGTLFATYGIFPDPLYLCGALLIWIAGVLNDPEQTDALPDAGWFSPDNPVVCSAP